MSDLSPVPVSIVQLATEYIWKERSDWEKFDNRTPLDSSGVYSLYALAREIYAAGWSDGHSAARAEAHGAKP